MVRTVVFQSEFKNEWQFDSNESPIAPGARELADMILEQLSKSANIIEPVELHSYNGWAFDLNFAGCRFHNVLNPADTTCYLTVELRWSWLRTMFFQHPRSAFNRFCELLEQTLKSIPEVSRVAWLRVH